MRKTLSISFILIASFSYSSEKIDAQISIKNARSIFKNETDWLNLLIPGIIAILAVVISSIVTANIAKKQLKLNQSQITEQSRIAIESVRANNISNARIEWIQKLRPLMGNLITIAVHLDYSLYDYKESYMDTDNSLKTDLTREQEDKRKLDWHKMIDNIMKFDLVFNEIELFLNHNEDTHIEFMEKTNKYIDSVISFEKSTSNSNSEKISEEVLITCGRAILKHAWEQAKNDVNSQ